jgi:hypothetical protein
MEVSLTTGDCSNVGITYTVGLCLPLKDFVYSFFTSGNFCPPLLVFVGRCLYFFASVSLCLALLIFCLPLKDLVCFYYSSSVSVSFVCVS